MGKTITINRNVYLKKLGHNIRKARSKIGLSQEALAFAADLDRSYVGGVERGERNITLLNLKKISAALNINISELVKTL
jgi:transcriptional regulator with XRE-family HTH domain